MGKYTVPAIILILTFLLSACDGGPSLIVGPLTGPDTVTEFGTAQFSISAEGDTGIMYQWAVDPPGAGYFSTQLDETIDFTAAEVFSDTQVTISVVISSDNASPVYLSLIHI